MTDDLVKRLRSNRPIPTLPHEAADRIEALTAENEWLREERFVTLPEEDIAFICRAMLDQIERTPDEG